MLIPAPNLRTSSRDAKSRNRDGSAIDNGTDKIFQMVEHVPPQPATSV